MRNLFVSIVFVVLAACGQESPPPDDPVTGLPSLSDHVAGMKHMPGFLDLHWDEENGRLFVAVEEFDAPFIYFVALARGVGSNDLALDRGQLGGSRLVRFQRSGPRVLLVQDNTGYVAHSDNPAEVAAVEESFARSVLGGFEVVARNGETLLIDATSFFLRDAHRVGPRLKAAGEGQYEADENRSAIYPPLTRSFADNTEIEAIVTLAGAPEGPHLPTVTPDADTVTVHQRHSFVRLPEAGYEPLPYDPRSGYSDPSSPWSMPLHHDYATPFDEPLRQPLTLRHRLAKRDPGAAVSEAVEPIVYYVERGTPEPIRSALMDGASWWAAGFETAGFRDAFRVELLPEGVDPLDIRYNVIQWVHRSTRGWSYGLTIVDPRTGEILKGQVSLGSLRVRQDYLLAEGLLAPYEDHTVPEEMGEFALARIRQLAAHEVGHTLGLDHNFAASADGRASVMDYPFPLVTLGADGGIDVSAAYDTGLGEFDKRAIEFGYRQYGDNEASAEGREQLIQDRIAAGLHYVSDIHSRADLYTRYPGAANPLGNLWDNGSDPVAELTRITALRARVLDRFSERTVRHGRPLSAIENALVPMYLLHRYQIQAAAKSLGGQYFTYALRGDGQIPVSFVPPAAQRDALAALLATLEPSFLGLRPELIALIPPRPPGQPRAREIFPRKTGYVFDPLAAAAVGAGLTLDQLIDPLRAARMINTHAIDASQPGFQELVNAVMQATFFAAPRDGRDGELQRVVNTETLERLLALAARPEAMPQARAIAYDSVVELGEWLERQVPVVTAGWRAHYRFASGRISRFLDNPESVPPSTPVPAPPGSPIGG